GRSQRVERIPVVGAEVGRERDRRSIKKGVRHRQPDGREPDDADDDRPDGSADRRAPVAAPDPAETDEPDDPDRDRDETEDPARFDRGRDESTGQQTPAWPF